MEIQVRTVFEEAWSEIDHIMRYPYDTDNPVITEYLAIFNRMVGCADEMGTFLKKVKKDFSLGKELPENLIDYLDNEDWRDWYQQLETLQLVRFLTNGPNIKEFR